MYFLHSFYSVSIPSACDGFVGASFTAGYFTIAASKIVTSVNCQKTIVIKGKACRKKRSHLIRWYEEQ